jgi:lysophospholipase L1-like esterase
LRSRTVSAAIVAALALLAGAAGTAGTAQAAEKHRPVYYVSLGDSLAAGYQPDVDGDTTAGYTEMVYAALKKDRPNLRHIKLGCSGETSTSLIKGGLCDYTKYGAKSQLDAATGFLREHRGRIAAVTLTIGANDVLKCAADGIDPKCFADSTAKLGVNTTRIGAKLRWSGGPKARYAGSRYYNPLLANWLTGPDGQALARASAPLLTSLNSVLSLSYRLNGFRVAQVDKAFDTGNFTDRVTLPGVGEVPKNVANTCGWTWMCTPFKDIHANPTGHRIVADTFMKALKRR